MKKFVKVLSAITACLLCMCMLALSACSDGGGETSNDATVTAISLVTANAQTTFDKDDAFTAAGLSVSATMSDSTVRTVFAEDCEISAPDMATRGEKTVNVSYGGATDAYNITVREIESIAVDASGATTEFLPGAEFSYSGVTVTAKYFDIDEREIVADFEIVAPDMTTVGEKTVTVSYKGKTAEYKINVHVETSYSVSSVELVKDETAGKVSVVLHGVYAGFTRDEFVAKAVAADLQHNGAGNNWDYTDVQPVVDVGDGTFDITLDVTELSPFGYILHFDKDANGNSLNLTVAGQPQTVELNGKRYALTFQDQTNFYGSAGVTVSYVGQEDVEVELSTARVFENDGKIYFDITGTISNYIGDRSDIKLDIQRITPEQHLDITSTLEMTDTGEFTVTGDLSSSGMSTSGDWLIHLFVLGKSYDVRDIATDADSTVTAGGVVWTLKSEAYFGGNPMKFVIIRARSESGEEFTYSLNGMSLKEEDSKAYIEFTGTYTGAPLDSDFTSIYFDCENNPNEYGSGDWDFRGVFDLEIVSVENGAFTLCARVDSLNSMAYTLHFGGTAGDIHIVQAEQSLTIGGKTYTLVCDGSRFWGGSGLIVRAAE